MKSKTIKIEIEIEREFQTGLFGKMEIREMIFTDYSHLLDFETILNNYKFALKKLDGFTMLTATLMVYNSNSWTSHDQEIISSFRYVNKYNEVKKSRLNGNCYNDFQENSLKNILPDIKEMVEKGNRKFIDLLKEA